MLAALPPTVTRTGTLVAGLGGVAVALLGPLLRVRPQRRHDPTVPASALWATLLGCELLAVVVLYSVGKAWGVIPTLATPLKVGVILLGALLLTGVSALLPAGRRSRA